MPDGTAPAPIDRKTLAALSERSDAAGWRQLAGHLLLLAATGSLVWLALDSWWVWPAMLAHGVALIFLFAPLHETIHRTAFATRAVNDGVAFVLGAVILLPREHFRAFHFAHHRFTQDPARDPELATPKPVTFRQWLWLVTGLPYWIAQARLLLRHASGRATEPFYKDDRQRARVIAEARLVLAIYGVVLAVSLVAGSLAALHFWVIPALLGQPFLRLYLLAEHTLCPLWPADMWISSRTTRTNAVLRRLAWNMPYHGAHHACPSVPFHVLPRLDALVSDQRKTIGPGYLGVTRQILRALNGR